MSFILTADMEGFSSWMQSDEGGVIHLLTETYYRLSERMVELHSGLLFQKEGDAIWCRFEQADEALAGGLWLLEQLQEHNKLVPSNQQVKLRVGIASGERDHSVMKEARRLEASASPGAVHFDEQVYGSLAEARGVPVERGPEASYELFPEVNLRTQTLLFRLEGVQAEQRLQWTRRFLALCHRTGSEAYLSRNGLLLASLPKELWPQELPVNIPGLQWEELRDGGVSQRLDGLKEKLFKAPSQPYKFLSSFKSSDFGIFFGRDQELQLLSERLEQPGMLLIYGKSGVGKSSLLNAGLPFLKDIPEVERLRIHHKPLEELNSWLEQGLGASEQGRRKQVLVIDQFESVFVHCDIEETQEFVRILRERAESFGSQQKIVLSLREDFLAHAFSLETEHPGLFSNRIRLTSLSESATRESIAGPAQLFGVTVEDSLQSSLLSELRDEGVHPAELQIVLDKLYRIRSQSDRISLDDFLRAGGVSKILADFLDEALMGLPSRQRNTAKLFLKIFVNSSGLREPVARTAMEKLSGLRSSEIDSLLTLLCQARLLTRVADKQELSYELLHQTLVAGISSWETPEELARRHAKVMLRHEIRNSRRHGTLIPKDRLEILGSDIGLALSEEERLTVVRACALHSLDPLKWMPEAEHRRASVPLFMELLKNGAVNKQIRRLLLPLVATLPLGQVALEELFQISQELINPSVLQVLRKDASPTVVQGFQQALELRFFGDKSTVLVPGGSCWLGSSAESKERRKKLTRVDLHPRIDSEMDFHETSLEEFRMDRLAVTNELYAEFEPLHRHFFPPEEGQLPAVNVSYHEAKAYADWLGKSLPTEMQWEKAARGTDGQSYPWGNDFHSERLNSGESERRALLEVDSFPNGASPYGCRQMSGNVWEWTCTPWEPDSPLMAKKGGCALNYEPLMHCSARFEDAPDMRLRWAGFRLCF